MLECHGETYDNDEKRGKMKHTGHWGFLEM